MPPRRPCLGFGGQTCRLLTNGSRCATHARMYEAARRPNRPSARQRGYDAEYDANRAALRAQRRPLCWRCAQPIDYALTYPNPMAFTADHKVTRSHGGSNALSNLLPAHSVCNSSRGDAA